MVCCTPSESVAVPLVVPAARMPAVNGKVIKARASQLRAAGERKVKAHLEQQVGKTHQILMENARMGRTEQFTEVVFGSDQVEGQIVAAQIVGSNGAQLTV